MRISVHVPATKFSHTRQPQVHSLVAVPVTGEGHTTPMMHLCERLARSGFSITFVLEADSTGDSIRSKGTWPPADLDIKLEELRIDSPFPWHAVTEEKLDLTVIHEHLRAYQGPLEQLIKKLGDVCCVVSDYQMSWAVDAAINLGVPAAILFTGCATWSWFEYNMPRLVSQGIVPMQQGQELPQEDDFAILEHPRLLRSEIPWHFWNDKGWQDFTVKHNSGSFEKANWVLIASCYELEQEIVNTMRKSIGNKFIPIGPLFLLNNEPHRVGLRKFDESCTKWLDEQPASSVLYIAFGSLASLSAEQLEHMVMGLEASNQRFLWVIRADTSTDFSKTLLESNNRGLIVSWSPQTQVLAHKSVAAFLSHSGWNSTMEGVTNGKPILSWPCRYEQNIDCRLIVEDWKVGIKLRRKSSGLVDKDEIEQAIRRVMTDGEEARQIKQRAEKLRQMIRRAVVPGGSSQANLEAFIDAL